MSENEEKAIGLLNEKRNLLFQVLSSTESANLSSGGAEEYVRLMDFRTANFERIYEIDRLLEDLGCNDFLSADSKEFNNEAVEIQNASRAMAFRITELDKSNKAVVEKIREEFKNEFKEINKSKNVRNLYSDTGKLYDGYYFDKTK